MEGQVRARAGHAGRVQGEDALREQHDEGEDPDEGVHRQQREEVFFPRHRARRIDAHDPEHRALDPGQKRLEHPRPARDEASQVAAEEVRQDQRPDDHEDELGGLLDHRAHPASRAVPTPERWPDLVEPPGVEASAEESLSQNLEATVRTFAIHESFSWEAARWIPCRQRPLGRPTVHPQGHNQCFAWIPACC